MNMRALAQEFRDTEEEGRLAIKAEALEVSQIAMDRTRNCGTPTLWVADQITGLPVVDEAGAIVLIAAITAQLRRFNMHQQYRRDLVHELSNVVVSLDDELLSRAAAEQ